MIATIVRKDAPTPALRFAVPRWLVISEVRIMPRLFVLTAIIVTLCAVATILAAADQTSFSPILAGL